MRARALRGQQAARLLFEQLEGLLGEEIALDAFQESCLDHLSRDPERVGANRLAAVDMVRAGISVAVGLDVVGAALGTLQETREEVLRACAGPSVLVQSLANVLALGSLFNLAGFDPVP